MRQRRVAAPAQSALRGLTRDRRLDYLANVIKRGEAPMSPSAVTPMAESAFARADARRRLRRARGRRRRRVAAGRASRRWPRSTSGPTRTAASIYSDQPPTGNFKVESINAPPPPANPNAVKELANKEAELRRRSRLRADEEAKATKARVEANLKREQCDRARGQIDHAGADPTRSCSTPPTPRASALTMDDAARAQGAAAARRRGCGTTARG